MSGLIERQEEYEAGSKQSILRRVPVVIKVNGSSFARLTKNIKKPVDNELTDILVYTTHYIASEIQGCCFAYCWSDKLIFILKNDQTLESQPWYDNDIQSICSMTTSLATLGFAKCTKNFGNGLVLNGDALFKTQVFPIPSITEAYNYLVAEQKQCDRFAVSQASRVELRNALGRKLSEPLLEGKNTEEKIELLNKHCNIKFNDYYANSYRLGTAIYKVPNIISGRDFVKNKWQINWNTPSFVDKRDSIQNILVSGHDVFRAGTLIV